MDDGEIGRREVGRREVGRREVGGRPEIGRLVVGGEVHDDGGEVGRARGVDGSPRVRRALRRAAGREERDECEPGRHRKPIIGRGRCPTPPTLSVTTVRRVTPGCGSGAV